MIKSWSTTQTVVAMSSGESEYYGLARGGCEGIGLSGLVHNPTGKDLKIGLETDSSAAKGIATRRGVGKVRHLEVRTLWQQYQVDRGRIRPKKVDGATNSADVCTKYLDAARLTSLLAELPVSFAEGRHPLAPLTQGAVQTVVQSRSVARRCTVRGGGV